MTALEALQQRKLELEKICACWKSESDGSYERTLDARGYYQICDEIKQLNEVMHG